MGRKYIFTDKHETKQGIMSPAGSLSRASIVLAVYGTFQNQGEALVKYGAAVLFALLFSLAGLVLGILSRMVQDRFYFFSNLGMTLNGLALAGIVFIIYAGVYGL